MQLTAFYFEKNVLSLAKLGSSTKLMGMILTPNIIKSKVTSIKYRVIVLLLALTIIYVLLTTIILRTGMLQTFTNLEQEFADQNADRVDQYIMSELDRIDDFSVDWSYWTETQQFMLGNDPDYAASNLTDDAPVLINVNILAFIDLQNNLVWGGVFESETAAPLPFEDHFELPISASPKIFQHDELLSITKGIVSGPGPAMILASRPILNNTYGGPIAGTLVIGRLMDEHFINEMNENLSIDAKVHTLTDNGLNPDLEFALAALSKTSDSGSVDSETKNLQFNRYYDIYDEPAFILEIASERRILDIGNNTVNTAITLMVVSLLIFIFAILIMLERLIIRPVRQLKDHIHKMQEDQDLSQHITMTRTDEFGEMAREFNVLTSKLNDSKVESEAARKAAISASSAKSDFLATMSHEIRTPMNGVLGMADLLLATKPLSLEQEQYVRTINHSGGSLLKILNDILDFSKIEAGKFILEDTEFSLCEVLEDSAELLAYEIQSKGLDFIIDIPPELQNRFIGDVGRIRQIVLNLLSNATKFTDTGYICLRAKCIADDKDKVLVHIEIEDSGIGILEANQGKLFRSFTQEDASTTRKFGGTGLGLAVTKQLAELMDGEVGFQSTPQIGSTFWTQIPLELVPGNTDTRQGSLTGYTAILQPTESLNAKVLETQLKYWGAHVHIMQDGAEITETTNTLIAASPEKRIILFLDSAICGSQARLELKALRENFTTEKLEFILLNPVTKQFTELELLEHASPILLGVPVRINSLYSCFKDKKPTIETQPTPTHIIESESINALLSADLRVLLVEDNTVNVMVAKNMLKKLGCDVTVAVNGQEAVDLCLTDTFDIVLMDCSMPVMDGFEATQILRQAELDNKTERLTIIALTANAMEGDRERCLEIGMDDFLPKPISIKTLSEKLDAQRIPHPENQYSQST